MNTDSGSCLIIVDNDDEFVDRSLVLFDAKYQCHIAKTGSAGLALFRQLSDQKALVICSANLSDMSGLDVCRLIKREDAQTFVMLTSNAVTYESRMSALLAQADNVIDKSITDEELNLWVFNIYSTLNKETTYLPDENEIGDISDQIFCALEAEVRSLIESYYQLTLEEREGRECTSKYVAECLGRSQRTFQREIKMDTGYSFKQLQLIVRLEVAQELFAEGYNVNQVADLLSFSSPAHLSRAFKEEFGITPSKYRRLLK